jgi:hypothetical protein
MGKNYRNISKSDYFRHNYLKLLPEIAKCIEPGGLYLSTIYHDDWCDFWENKNCNCNPASKTVTLARPNEDYS